MDGNVEPTNKLLDSTEMTIFPALPTFDSATFDIYQDATIPKNEHSKAQHSCSQLPLQDQSVNTLRHPPAPDYRFDFGKHKGDHIAEVPFNVVTALHWRMSQAGINATFLEKLDSSAPVPKHKSRTQPIVSSYKPTSKRAISFAPPAENYATPSTGKDHPPMSSSAAGSEMLATVWHRSFANTTTSSSSPSDQPEMSFVERMMAKMGHVESQGVGRNKDGIAEPIQTPTQRIGARIRATPTEPLQEPSKDPSARTIQQTTDSGLAPDITVSHSCPFLKTILSFCAISRWSSANDRGSRRLSSIFGLTCGD
ncbi:hypothetical protein BDV96DRAFT_664251 [Lophiotrema nucula]|uniref:G-patch domain-containing protein n=1 Tax=Lophiotrema nucula TaxID=690887 RepID=A0A6A5Z2R8_9PLEO|nr:hypothetical protein BDV96DRAFT_664251 [Lophiotrema nucula]